MIERKVIGSNIRYAYSPDTGMMVDWGEGWHYTHYSWDEIERMHPSLEPAPPNSEDEDREIFGDTLDDPIPDELWELTKI